MNSQAKPPRRLFAFRPGAQLRGRYGIGADVRDSGPGPSHRPKLLSIRRGTRSPIDFGASGRMLPGRSFRDTRKVAPLHPFQPAIVPAVRSFDSRFAFRYAQAFRVELPCVRRFFLAKRSVASNKNLDFSKIRTIYSGTTAFRSRSGEAAASTSSRRSSSAVRRSPEYATVAAVFVSDLPLPRGSRKNKRAVAENGMTAGR